MRLKYFQKIASNDPREYEFCSNIHDDWVKQKGVHIINISLPVQIILAITIQFVANPLYAAHFQTVHGIIAALLILGKIWIRTENSKAIQHLAAIPMVLCGIFYSTLLYIHAVDSRITTQEITWMVTGAIYFHIVGLIFMPYSGRKYFAANLLGFAFLAVALSSTVGGVTLALIAGFAMIFIGQSRYETEKEVCKMAHKEYSLRSTIAPAHFVRKSNSAKDQFEDFFKPEINYCVCLSSDWRNYQETSSQLSPEQLTNTLNAYYNLCEEILREVLPDGNYYTDWIADELFIVFHATENVDAKHLVNYALTFSHKLIRARPAFCQEYGIPRAIDVGVSAGDALLGLMGPDGHKKATALGEIPGRSRRLQAAGKLLRKDFGEEDRVLFGEESLLALTMAFNVKHYKLEGTKIRDVEDNELYYLEPVSDIDEEEIPSLHDSVA